MKIERDKKQVRFCAEDEGFLEVRYTNMGEPYREGIEVALEDGDKLSFVFIEQHEAKQLRDLLNKLYPKGDQK